MNDYLTVTEGLSPRSTLDTLFPPNSTYAPRSTLDQLHWVVNEAYRLDSLTGATLSVMGEMPLICHRDTATPRILEFFRLAGLEPPRTIHLYDNEAGAQQLAQREVGRGWKLASPYPPFPAFASDECLVVPLQLYEWLNDKANLDDLVDAENLPPRVVLPVDRLDEVVEVLPGRAVFVKACHAGASGGGKDVRFCADTPGREEAVSWLAGQVAQLSAVRVEEAMNVGTSWCVSVAISDGQVRVLGSAAQLFREPGQQSGSRIDPEDAPPATLLAVVRKVAELASDRGYRGVGAFDLAVTPEGHVMVFDLNFRLGASTPQVLLHDSAVRRIGGRITQSWTQILEGELAPALNHLAGYAQEGVFVPTRLYEGTPANGGKTTITGFLVAHSVVEANALDATLRDSLRDLAPSS